MNQRPRALRTSTISSWLLVWGALAASAQPNSIPHPTLDELEAAVREQLTDQQELLKTATNTDAPAAELAAAFGDLGLAYQAYGFLDAAAAAYRNAERLAPETPLWSYALGETARLLGRPEEAIAAYQRTLSTNGDVVPALVRLAELQLAAGDLATATPLLERALALAPEDAAVHAAVGQAALSRQDFAAAARAFENALALAPEANRLHYPLALAYRGLQDSERARRHFAASGAVGVRLGDPLLAELDAVRRGERTHIARGRAAFRAGRYLDAAAEFRAAIAASPDSVPAHVNLGGALAGAGETAAARQAFQTALLLAPDNFTAHFNLGLLAHKAADANAAITHLEAAVALAPGDVEARFALALALEPATDTARCLAAYAAARRLAPDREDLWLNPAGVLARRGEVATAAALLQEGLVRLPESTQLRQLLSQLQAPR
jgi:tetratricopeptide (TPR) repeat protein